MEHKFFARFKNSLSDDELRINIQYGYTYLVLGIVSAFMTIINLFTYDKYPELMWSTFVFAILQFIDYFFSKTKSNFLVEAAKILCGVEFVVLCVFFLVLGQPEGFSVLWALLLPSCGLTLFGRKRGVIFNLITVCIFSFLLHSDIGNEIIQYKGYTDSFKLRFPVLYLAFLATGYIFETIRVWTSNSLHKVQEQLEYSNYHDQLTNALNRKGLLSYIKETENERMKHLGDIGFIMYDIDHFKVINDTYGHSSGDIILKELSELVSEYLGCEIARWGGEEFVCIFSRAENNLTLLDGLINKIATHEFIAFNKKIPVTVSIGSVVVANSKDVTLDYLVSSADECLYKAKNSGRNKVIHERIEPPTPIGGGSKPTK